MYKKLFFMAVILSFNLNSMSSADVNSFINAAKNGNKSQINHIINLSDDIDVNAKNITGQTALMAASQNGHIDIVKLLIKLGANVFIRDLNHKSAMDYADENNHKEILDFLIKVAKKQKH